MQAVLAHPENMALVKRLIGLEELVIPDEESRTKQYREIAQLVLEVPVAQAIAACAPSNEQRKSRHTSTQRDIVAVPL